MKLYDENMQRGAVGGFAFSGVRPDNLSSPEYTLATVLVDKTGSVSGYEAQLLEMKRMAFDTCKASPRADWLMFRSVLFNESVDEECGFVEARSFDTTLLSPPKCGGGTALFDAMWAAAAATNEYAKTLFDRDFSVNGILFVVTDGDDTSSSRGVNEVRAEIERGVKAEWLESFQVVLIGVNAARYHGTLSGIATALGIDPYVDAGSASADNLARLARFVSKSVSSASLSLGSGGPSQPLTF